MKYDIRDFSNVYVNGTVQDQKDTGGRMGFIGIYNQKLVYLYGGIPKEIHVDGIKVQEPTDFIYLQDLKLKDGFKKKIENSLEYNNGIFNIDGTYISCADLSLLPLRLGKSYNNRTLFVVGKNAILDYKLLLKAAKIYKTYKLLGVFDNKINEY